MRNFRELVAQDGRIVGLGAQKPRDSGNLHSSEGEAPVTHCVGSPAKYK
jgi:hypothetical protein